MNLLLQDPSNPQIAHSVIELAQLPALDELDAQQEKVQKIDPPYSRRDGFYRERIISWGDIRGARRARGWKRSNTAQHRVLFTAPFFTDLHHTCGSRLVFITPGFTTTFFSDSVLPREGGARCVSSPYFPLEMLDTRRHFPLDRIYVSSLSIFLSRLLFYAMAIHHTIQILLPGVELINCFEVN